MFEQQRDEFLNAYYKLLVKAWNDPLEMARIQADPTAAARQAGLPVAPGAHVRLITSAGRGDIEDQITAFAKGTEDGEHVLYVAPQPLLDLAELTDDDISEVGGGNLYCCCPCCCST